MTVCSVNPRSGQTTSAAGPSSPEEVDAAAAAASTAASPATAVPSGVRTGWLNAIATAVEADSDTLAGLADEETALGLPRLTGDHGGPVRAAPKSRPAS